MQVIIKQKVRLKTTLAGLAKLDGLHTHLETGGGCTADKFLWEAIPDSDTIWEERLPVLSPRFLRVTKFKIRVTN